jgi:hypothetical protein
MSRIVACLSACLMLRRLAPAQVVPPASSALQWQGSPGSGLTGQPITVSPVAQPLKPPKSHQAGLSHLRPVRFMHQINAKQRLREFILDPNTTIHDMIFTRCFFGASKAQSAPYWRRCDHLRQLVGVANTAEQRANWEFPAAVCLFVLERHYCSCRVEPIARSYKHHVPGRNGLPN